MRASVKLWSSLGDVKTEFGGRRRFCVKRRRKVKKQAFFF
jgi:hypothetical protein